jgi:AAA15 family ATPase/GTPase
MIDEIILQNYRAFKKETISDCGQFNVIVGDNGSGKTAILEALFYACCNSPEGILRTKAWRGLPQSVDAFDVDFMEQVWGDLFYDGNLTKDVWIRLKDRKGSFTRSFYVSKGAKREIVIRPRISDSADSERESHSQSFRFRWKGPGKIDHEDIPRIEDRKLVFGAGQEAPLSMAFFAANQTYSALETASRYSKLSRKGKNIKFNMLFSKLFPNVGDVSVEVVNGSPILCARDKQSGISTPINSLSGGMAKLASILVAIPNSENGYILLDEFENGIYYKRLKGAWNAIVEFATSYGVQIFLTTHSSECLSVLANAAENHQESYRLFRTVRQNGGSVIRSFSGDQFTNAIAEEIEIR